MDDAELLEKFSKAKSEAAFNVLVERYLPLVYSAALRQVGNAALSQQVTQVVFILLARTAERFSGSATVVGWVYSTTCSVAAKVGGTQRQQVHPAELIEASIAELPTAWEELAPALDEAMIKLEGVERDAVLLRYFLNRSPDKIELALGLSEDNGQAMVSHAIKELHRALCQRGVAISLKVLAGLLATHAAQFAPTHLGGFVLALALDRAPIPTPVYALLQGAKRVARPPNCRSHELWEAAGRVLVTLLIVAGVAVWWFRPKPKPDAFSFTFDTRVIAHPFPPPSLAEKTVPATVVASAAVPVKQTQPVRPDQTPALLQSSPPPVRVTAPFQPPQPSTVLERKAEPDLVPITPDSAETTQVSPLAIPSAGQVVLPVVNHQLYLVNTQYPVVNVRAPTPQIPFAPWRPVSGPGGAPVKTKR